MTERDSRRAILAVALASALLCLPFLGRLPLFDPDEGYYPAAAAESMASGHPLDLRLDGEPRWNKPPLSYALMQVSMAALGKSEFAVRLPSVLEGAALVAILGFVVARVTGGAAGLLAAVVLASSLGHQVMTRAAHPEMGLVLGTAAAQLLLAEWFVSHRDTRPRAAWWLAGLAMGFAFLCKGPTALAMPALMLVAGMLVVPRDGRPSWGEVGRVFGPAAALALAIAAPWFLWMGSRHPEFWGTVLGEVGRQAEKDPDGFRANPLFFIPVLVGAFLPWVLFLPSALRGLRRADPAPAARFSLLMALAAGTAFLFWSLSPAKNPHYALVFLPPLAALLACGSALDRWPMTAFAACAVVSSAFVVFLVGFGFSAIGVETPRRFSRQVLDEPAGTSAPVAVYRQRLPSMSFYLGRRVARLREPTDLEEWLRGPGTRFLVIAPRHADLAGSRGTTLNEETIGPDLRLVRFDPPGSPPPPAPAPAPPGGAPR